MRDKGKGGLLQSYVVDLRKEITVKIKKQQKQPRFPSTGSVRYNFSQEKLKLAQNVAYLHYNGALKSSQFLKYWDQLLWEENGFI